MGLPIHWYPTDLIIHKKDLLQNSASIERQLLPKLWFWVNKKELVDFKASKIYPVVYLNFRPY